jgi:hypothetical protein
MGQGKELEGVTHVPLCAPLLPAIRYKGERDDNRKIMVLPFTEYFHHRENKSCVTDFQTLHNPATLVSA